MASCVVLGLLAIGLAVAHKKNTGAKFAKQSLVIGLFFLLFWGSLLLSPIRPDVGLIKMWLPLVVSVVFCGLCFWVLCRKLEKEEKTQPSKRTRGASFLFLGLVLFYLVLQILDLGVSPIWDAGLYYSKLIDGARAYDLTLRSFFDNFVAYNHLTQMLMLLYMPGQYLFPGSVVALNATTMVLSAVMLYAYYKLAAMLLKGNEFKACGAAALFAFMPHVFGFATGINPDFGMLAGFIFVMYCYAYRKPVWLLFSALLLLFSKEPGIVLYGGFGLGILVCHWRTARRPNRLKSFFKAAWKQDWYLTIPIFIYAGYWVVDGWERLTSAGRLGNALAGNNGLFRLDLRHIVTVIKQLVVLNFSWIPAALVFVAITVWFFNKKARAKGSAPDVWNAFIGAGCAYLLFVILFSEIDLVRYMLPLMALMPVAMIWSLDLLKAIKWVKITAITGLFLLFVASCYLTIDPISKRVFRYSVDMGQEQLINVADSEAFVFVCEVHVYNRQYLDYSRLLDDVVHEYKNDPNLPYATFGVPPYSLQFFGNSENNYRLEYSSSKNARVFYADDAVALAGREYMEETEDMPKQALWIRLPYMDSEIPQYTVLSETAFKRGRLELYVCYAYKP